jgi:hypothetical protein
VQPSPDSWSLDARRFEMSVCAQHRTLLSH